MSFERSGISSSMMPLGTKVTQEHPKRSALGVKAAKLSRNNFLINLFVYFLK
jgi:hypothetical protein